MDWVSATAPRGTREHAMMRLGADLLDRQRAAGMEVDPWRWNGYDGRSAEGVSYGLREDGAYLRVSGAMAHEHWLPALEAATNVSRLDLEVTVRPEPADSRFGEHVYRDARRWSAASERRPTVKKVETAGHTETVYVGRRISDQSGRVYDKHRESRRAEWRDCWRYEVEARRSVAAGLAGRLRADPDPGGAIRLYVRSWFSRRGHRPGFPSPPGELRVPRVADRPTAERQLMWLDEQVMPVTAGLIADGHGQAVMKRLGFTVPLMERLVDGRHPT